MPPSKKTLIFHIGDRKTGSTSIQSAFSENRVSLSHGSVFYPKKRSPRKLSEHFEAYIRPDKPKQYNTAIRAFENMAARIDKSEVDYCLISCEGIEAIPASRFHEIVTSYFKDVASEIRVIAYVRPHAARIVSSLAQRIKGGFSEPILATDTFEDFFDRVREKNEFVYLPRFCEWREHFGDAFILRPMIPAQLYRGSVVDDCIRSAFGTEAFTVAGDDIRLNKSPSLEDLMQLKLLQTRLFPHTALETRKIVGKEFTRLLETRAGRDKAEKLCLHKSLAVRVRETYRADAQSLDQQFFGGQPLFEDELSRAVETAIPEPQQLVPSKHFSSSEIRSLEIFSDLLAAFLENRKLNRQGPLPSKQKNNVRKLFKKTVPVTGD